MSCLSGLRWALPSKKREVEAAGKPAGISLGHYIPTHSVQYWRCWVLACCHSPFTYRVLTNKHNKGLPVMRSTLIVAVTEPTLTEPFLWVGVHSAG